MSLPAYLHETLCTVPTDWGRVPPRVKCGELRRLRAAGVIKTRVGYVGNSRRREWRKAAANERAALAMLTPPVMDLAKQAYLRADGEIANDDEAAPLVDNESRHAYALRSAVAAAIAEVLKQ